MVTAETNIATRSRSASNSSDLEIRRSSLKRKKIPPPLDLCRESSQTSEKPSASLQSNENQIENARKNSDVLPQPPKVQYLGRTSLSNSYKQSNQFPMYHTRYHQHLSQPYGASWGFNPVVTPYGIMTPMMMPISDPYMTNYGVMQPPHLYPSSGVNTYFAQYAGIPQNNDVTLSTQDIPGSSREFYSDHNTTETSKESNSGNSSPLAEKHMEATSIKSETTKDPNLANELERTRDGEQQAHKKADSDKNLMACHGRTCDQHERLDDEEGDDEEDEEGTEFAIEEDAMRSENKGDLIKGKLHIQNHMFSFEFPHTEPSTNKKMFMSICNKIWNETEELNSGSVP